MTNKTLKEVVDTLGNEEELTETVFRQKISTEIDSCVENLFRKISAYFNKTKFEKHVPEDITDVLKKFVEGEMSEFAEIIASINLELDDLRIDAQMPKQPMYKVGQMWHEYEDKP